MLKNKRQILLIGIIVCVVLSGSMVLGGYKASKITYTISGSSGMGGVTMRGLPGNPVTNVNGNYTVTVDYGWNGVVEPVKTGYVFEPRNRTYAKVTSDQGNQSYSTSVITLSVSGSTGVVGAVMDGLPGNPVTDQSGRYIATVDYGWKGTVVPVKEGFDFTPASKQYSSVTMNQTNGNYIAKLKTFTVSGATGIDGVVMKGLPGNPVARGGGLYAATVNHGWKGVVTPEKEGYTFEPADKTYGKIVGNQANQSYIAQRITLTISGTTGKSGVLMKGLPGDPVTDINGRYIARVNYGFAGSVTPTKAGLEFEPAGKTYAPVTKNQDQQDYTAELLSYIVSGRVAANGRALSGVVLSGLPGEPVTNENGHYSAIIEYGWNGLIAPVKEGYNFKPTNRIYDAITADLENQTYNAELLTYAISGVVKDAGMGVAGARVSTKNGTVFGMTNAKGEYFIKVNYGYSGTVTASKEGYVFQIATKSYEFVSEDQLNQHFDAVLKTFIISGNLGQSGVVVNGLPGNPVADENGHYTVTVNYGFSGTATPTKEGYLFSPSSRNYTKVTGVQGNQNYNADLLAFTISGTADIAGVEVSTDNGGGSCTTDASGNYSIVVPYGWSGTVTPTKEGYLFDPPLTRYLNVKSNIVEGQGGNEDEVFVDESNSFTEAVIETPIDETAKEIANCLVSSPNPKDAPPALTQRIESDLKSIDRAPQHVILDARIVVLNRSDLLNLDIEWSWPKNKAGAFSESGLHGDEGCPDSKLPRGVAIGHTTDQLFTNSLELTLNLLEQNGEATIVSSPQILAQDGKPAEIRVTTEEYYSSVPDVVDGQASYYNRSELEKIEYGTVLNITPHIGRNGDITLELSIEVSDVAVRNDNYPVVTRRVINTTMRIRDGDTVTVAGLKKHASTTSDTSAPGLSKLPIVGGLFSDKRTTEATQEVAIFITARLIRDSVTLVQPAKKVRKRAPSEWQAEEDFMTDLEKILSSQKDGK